LCLSSIFKIPLFQHLRKAVRLCFPVTVLNAEGPAAEKQESSALTPALPEESALAVDCWDSCTGAESDLAG